MMNNHKNFIIIVKLKIYEKMEELKTNDISMMKANAVYTIGYRICTLSEPQDGKLVYLDHFSLQEFYLDPLY